MPQLATPPFLLTVERIVTMYPQMTEDEKGALRLWEFENLGKPGVGTTDWPGWPAIVNRLAH